MGRNFRKNNGFISDGRRYQEHDDRGFETSRIKDRLGQKQVGFVDGVRGGQINKRYRGGGAKQINLQGFLPDDDLDLEADVRSDQAGRGRPLYGRGYRGKRGHFSRPMGGLHPGKNHFLWNKVTIRNGAKYDKNMVLKELLARCSVKFVPICYQNNKSNNNAVFFVEEFDAHRALKDLDKKIEMPDGFQLGISVERSTPPNMPVSEDLVDKIKAVMSDRYNTETCALNLTEFHKSFSGDSVYAPLWRLNIMTKVVDVILQYIPDVVAIDLSKNKLLNVDALAPMKTKLAKLNLLYLKDNKISDTRALEKLKGLKLVELKLEGNHVKETLGSSYTDTVRKIFPTLQVLDDKPLPKEIKFDDEATHTLEMPASIPKLVKSVEAGSLILQFLELFFKLYDSDNRQPLLDAYDENALMSLTAWGSYENMKSYIEESRNLLRVSSEHRRIKLLHRGRLPIVSFLSGLPKTQHDPTTFTLDLPFASPTLVIFTVTGIFKERETKNKGVRHFNRCFIVVPKGPGLCIINETLFICNATAENTKKAFISPESSMLTVNKQPEAASPVTLDEASKKTLATAFAEMSGMNIMWAARCLEENQWNYDKSAAIFQDLKASGNIPAEAFAKT